MAGHTEVDVHRVTACLREHLGGRVPDVGVVCGSGLASLVGAVTNKKSIPFDEVPTYPVPSVQGHVGEFVIGDIEDKVVILLRGRLHAYEGHPLSTIAAQIRVFAALGVRVVVVTNAAGGVNPAFNVGDFMCITDQLYLPGMAGNHPLVGKNDTRYAKLHAVAAEQGVADKLHSGVYAGLSGPAFESAAEIGAMRILGADAVGMSTAPEVVTAAHAGLSVMGVSLITNKCLGPGDDPSEAPNHEEVLEAARVATPAIVALIRRTIAEMDLAALPRSPAFEAFQGEPPAATATEPCCASSCACGPTCQCGPSCACGSAPTKRSPGCACPEPCPCGDDCKCGTAPAAAGGCSCPPPCNCGDGCKCGTGAASGCPCPQPCGPDCACGEGGGGSWGCGSLLLAAGLGAVAGAVAGVAAAAVVVKRLNKKAQQ
ncbi:PNP [Symbiodinium sp. KB8]|nr:PNP [Symbiodinium sp. KB8]